MSLSYRALLFSFSLIPLAFPVRAWRPLRLFTLCSMHTPLLPFRLRTTSTLPFRSPIGWFTSCLLGYFSGFIVYILTSYIRWSQTGLHKAWDPPSAWSVFLLFSGITALTSHYFCFKHSIMLERDLNKVIYIYPHNCQAQCSSFLCWLRLPFRSLSLSCGPLW